MTEIIRGELIDFRVRGSDFWGTGRVRTLHDGGEVGITGKVLGANPGDTLELEGWFETTKWGRQFKVKSCRVVLPSDTAGVVGWLSSKLPQISRRRAEQLVEQLGVEGLWKALDTGDTAPLVAIDGITPERAQEILRVYEEHKDDRDRMVRFKQWGLTDNQIGRVLEEWGEEAEERMMRNPYELIEFVKGFGWQRADQVALRMGVRRDDMARLCAGIMHAMDLATAAGHCYSPGGLLVGVVSKKICGVSEEPVRAALEILIDRGKLVRMGVNVYPPRLAQAEGRLAKVFAERARAARKGRAA